VWVEIEGNRIISKTINRAESEYAKEIPGRRWDKNKVCWTFPISFAACKQLRTTFGQQLQVGPELVAWAKREISERVQPCMEMRLALTDDSFEHSQMFDYQRAGAHFLSVAKHAILADPVGAGKSLQAIQAVLLSKVQGHKLIICPNSVKISWQRELAKWAPKESTFVIGGTTTQRARTFAAAKKVPGSWCIINWESLRVHSRLAPYGSLSLTEKEKQEKELNSFNFEVVIADEAHKLKDCKSKQTRSAWFLSHQSSVQYRFALTGTPLTNQLDTLFPILHFIAPEEWPVKSAFIDRYTLSHLNVWGALEVWGLRPEMQTEFEAIFEPRFRRLPKKVVLPQLPPIIRQQRYIDMSPKQTKSYTTMCEKMYAETDDEGIVIAQNPISQLTRLTQYASAVLEMIPEGPKMQEPSNKIDALLTDLEDYDEPVVVFAVSRQLIELTSKRLEKAGINHSIIKGLQTVDQRQAAIDSFMNGKVDIILVVIAAGGTGLNLNRGRIGIFLQRSWSNVDMTQAIGRIHRIGSEKFDSVLVVDYLSNNSVEIGQLQVLEGKADALEQIVKDKDTLRKLIKGENI
jgi:SNF2 family DNA or RNA helicase